MPLCSPSSETWRPPCVPWWCVSYPALSSGCLHQSSEQSQTLVTYPYQCPSSPEKGCVGWSALIPTHARVHTYIITHTCNKYSCHMCDTPTHTHLSRSHFSKLLKVPLQLGIIDSPLQSKYDEIFTVQILHVLGSLHMLGSLKHRAQQCKHQECHAAARGSVTALIPCSLFKNMLAWC